MTKKYPVGAGMVVFKDFEQMGTKVLILKCFNESWDMPKGRLDPGESLHECAVREMREEAGITTVEFPWGNAHMQMENLTFYICTTKQDPIIGPNPAHGHCEHDSAWWVDPSDAVLLLPELLKPAVQWAISILNQ